SRLLEAAPAVQQALDAIAAFRQLLHDRDSTGLEPWLGLAEASAIPEIRSFAATIRRDQPAVQAALDYSWSTGRIEGQMRVTSNRPPAAPPCPPGRPHPERKARSAAKVGVRSPDRRGTHAHAAAALVRCW